MHRTSFISYGTYLIVTRTVHESGFEPDKKGGHSSFPVCHYQGGVGHSAFTLVETGTAVKPGEQLLSLHVLSEKQEAPPSRKPRQRLNRVG
ncbi:MAG: hypothetical protein A07HR60_01716 [uncultured archaeon A07HR60]|nr:MAG: hypothetical protein A07HR60_01716 [uncultured archaeon A07HR60]